VFTMLFFLQLLVLPMFIMCFLFANEHNRWATTFTGARQAIYLSGESCFCRVSTDTKRMYEYRQ